MDNLNELKDIWMSADVSTLPATEKILSAIRKYRRKELLKKSGLLMLALTCAAVMTRVVIVYRSQMLATRLGEALILAAVGILLVSNTRSLRRIYSSESFSNASFIEHLRQEQQRQILNCRKKQLWGFLLSSSGLLLYLYEGVHEDQALMTGVYAAAAAWICLNWFVIRPAAIRKKTKHLQETIERLEALAEQLAESS